MLFNVADPVVSFSNHSVMSSPSIWLYTAMLGPMYREAKCEPRDLSGAWEGCTSAHGSPLGSLWTSCSLHRHAPSPWGLESLPRGVTLLSRLGRLVCRSGL